MSVTDVLRTQSRFVKCVGGSACGLTPTNFTNLLWARSTSETDLITNNVLTDMFQSRPKVTLLIRAFTRYVWQSCLWSFPSKIIPFVNIILTWRKKNFVIFAYMLVIAAFCLINMNLSVSDGVNLNSTLLLLCKKPLPRGQVFHRNRHPPMTCYFLSLYYLCLKDCRNPGKIARVPLCCL